MESYYKPIKLGDLELSSNVLYAPLAGCSDLPFRRMAKPYNPALFFCEMVKMEALIRHDSNTFRLLDYESDMHPIGGQLVGSNPKIAGQSAKILEELGFDLIDLNCGCPVDKVTKDGSGSGLLKTPELIGEILSEIVAAVKIPVTVKIRMGWDDTNINATQITEIAENAGARAITIHGRTRQQAYRGEANWQPIKECKQVAKSIKVIGNGDIFSGKAARAIFEQTGCDAVLISRGTMGAPWIIDEIRAELTGEPYTPPTPDQKREALLEHLEETLKYQNPVRALLDLRRISCWYIKKGENAKPLRHALSRIGSIEEAKELISTYAHY